jgi:hypothetical protein
MNLQTLREAKALLRRTILKMQVISVAFRMDMFGFQDLEYELLGMLKRRLEILNFFPVK